MPSTVVINTLRSLQQLHIDQLCCAAWHSHSVLPCRITPSWAQDNQALGVPCLPWRGACCLWPWTWCDPWGKKSESLLFQRYLTNVQAFFFFSFNKDLGFWGCISAVCGYSICCFSTELKYFLKMKLTSNFLLTFSLQGGIGLKMSKVQLILISKIHRPVKKEGYVFWLLKWKCF